MLLKSMASQSRAYNITATCIIKTGCLVNKQHAESLKFYAVIKSIFQISLVTVKDCTYFDKKILILCFNLIKILF